MMRWPPPPPRTNVIHLPKKEHYIMSAFFNAVRSETLKFTSLTSFWVYLAALIASLVGPIFIYTMFAAGPKPVGWDVVTMGGPVFTLIATVFMASAVAGEVETRMNAHAFLTQDRRGLWLGARILVAMVILLAAYIVAMVLTILVLLVMGLNLDLSNLVPLYSSVGSLIMVGLLTAGVSGMLGSRLGGMTLMVLWNMMLTSLVSYAAHMSPKLVFLWLLEPANRMEQLANQLVHTSGMPSGWDLASMQPMVFNIGVILIWLVGMVFGAFVVNARRDVR